MYDAAFAADIVNVTVTLLLTEWLVAPPPCSAA